MFCAIAALSVACTSPTETPSASTTSRPVSTAPETGLTALSPLLPGFAPRDESAVSPLVLDVMSYGNG
jgi:hypothetical protein